jgi:SAM-dependent methyltransferase
MQLPTASPSDMQRVFLDEYTSRDAILKYSTRTAGHGVNYLIGHEYARVYDRAIQMCRRTSTAPLRLLEFGCGVGMNLIGLVSRLEQQGIPVREAFGTDFSGALIESARGEARSFLPVHVREKVAFHVASNERLGTELASATGIPLPGLFGSFDLVFGVNTFRYCHRLHTADDCADQIHRLLRSGGVCVVIDMNDRFPLFRSRLKRRVESPEATYLPSLDEYAEPFERAGFEIVAKRHFCWVPHSAGPSLTRICRTLTPILDATVPNRAMRSLVVAEKPA